MSMNNQGRPSGAGEAFPASIATISGDRGLDHEESLIFELGHGAIGVDRCHVSLSDPVEREQGESDRSTDNEQAHDRGGHVIED